MPGKRFSVAAVEGKGGLAKAARLENSAALLADARPWGSAFWVFEGPVHPSTKFATNGHFNRHKEINMFFLQWGDIKLLNIQDPEAQHHDT